jgi:flavodoxin
VWLHVNVGIPDFSLNTIKENMMNALVVYESQFGNTEKVAQTVAGALRAFGEAQAVRVDPAHPIELQGIDMLVVGGPTQSWGVTSGLRSFLAAIPPAQLRSLRVACFDTRLRQPRWLTGSAAGVMAKNLQKLGVSPLVPAESFLVSGQQGPLISGELDRAAAWAQTLGKTGTARQEQKGKDR